MPIFFFFGCESAHKKTTMKLAKQYATMVKYKNKRKHNGYCINRG